MSTQSAEDLKSFLSRSSDSLIYNLAYIVGDPLGFNGLRKRIKCAEDVPQAKNARDELIEEIVRELRYFGSNNFAYLCRWMIQREKGVEYEEVVSDVALTLNRQLKKKVDIPRVASIEERERLICGQLLGIILEGKDEEQLSNMLEEAGLGRDAIKAAAIKAAVQAGAGTLLVALTKVLGKKAVTQILSAVAYKIVAQKVGKEAAEQLLKIIVKKIPQKTFSRLLGWIGAALILKDFIDLAAAGMRVTIPAVALIAALRQAETLKGKRTGAEGSSKSALAAVASPQKRAKSNP